MGNPIQYPNTDNPSQIYRGGLATRRTVLYNGLGTSRGVIHNRKIVMISPPGAYTEGGFKKRFTGSSVFYFPFKYFPLYYVRVSHY